jgi:3-oxoadipate enol-lactonase
MAAADRYFPAGSADLRYRDAGHGPPIVFVHGWALDLDMWEPQVAGLLPSHRVIRWDRRGFGLSGGQPGITNDVADVHALCQRLDIQRAAFVGMSHGARVICALARTAPSLISCLVFDGSPDLTCSPGVTANDVPLDRFRSLVRERDLAVFRQEWRAHPLAQLRTREQSANELLRTMIDRYPATDLLRAQVSGTDGPVLEAVLAARIPALVINGEFDLRTRLDAGKALARVLPGSQYASIPNAGHLPNLDNPAVYNAVLRDFVARNEPLHL